MHNRKLFLFGCLPVFVLSLISCTDSEKKAVATGPWSLSEPVITTANGSVKYGEANTIDAITFSLDDRLVFSGDLRGVRLNSEVACSRDTTRATATFEMPLREEMKISEFMPQEIVYSPERPTLSDVTCTLKLVATNSAGSIHVFPALNLPMSDKTHDEIALQMDMRPITAKNGQLPRILFDQFDDVILPGLNAGEEYNLYCETVKAASNGRAVRSLADLKLSGEMHKIGKREVCRVLRQRPNGSVTAVSTYFILEYLDFNEFIAQEFVPNLHLPASHYSNDLNGTIGRITFKNSKNESFYFHLPKRIPAQLYIRAIGAAWDFHAELNSNLHVEVRGQATVEDAQSHWVVQLAPGRSIEVKFDIRRVRCAPSVIYQVAPLAQPTEATILNNAQKVVTTFQLLPEYLPIYSVGQQRQVPTTPHLIKCFHI